MSEPPPATPDLPTLRFSGNPALMVSLVAYLKTASEICGWTLPGSEKQSIDTFVNTTNKTGNFQAKYRLNMELSRNRSAINERGQLAFCEDAREHQKFDMRASSLANGTGAQR